MDYPSRDVFSCVLGSLDSLGYGLLIFVQELEYNDHNY